MQADATMYLLWNFFSLIIADSQAFIPALHAQKNSEWGCVNIIMIGRSSQLFVENKMLQEKAKALIEAGGKMSACRASLEQNNTLEAVKQLGYVEIIDLDPDYSLLCKNEFDKVSLV